MNITDGQNDAAVIYDAIDHMPFSLVIYDRDDRVVASSRKFRETYQNLGEFEFSNPQHSKIEFEDLLRAVFSVRADPDLCERRIALEKKRHRTQGGWNRDAQVDGVWERKTCAISDSGTVVAASIPIDELIKRSAALAEAKRMLEVQAYHDALTGLPNRRGLTNMLNEVLTREKGQETQIAVLNVDLDKFKSVNDTLGHDAGDKVLVSASEILRDCIRTDDFCARIGGDEFVVVCPDIEHRDIVADIAQNIITKMKEPIPFQDEYCQIGASIGIVLTDGKAPAQELLREADIALYESKRKGRGRFEFFRQIYRERHFEQLRGMNVMREAMQLRAFEPFFQPQVDLTTGALIGFEALARWNDLESGVHHPSEFFSLLESAHLMSDLDNLIVEKTIDALARWRCNDITLPRVSFNTSANWLRQHKIVEWLQWKIDDAGLEPAQFGIEILEQAVRTDETAQISDNVRRLSDAGFSVALDHFGTGDASILSLRQFRFDRVKIDEYFAKGVEKDEELNTISRAMISLISTLGIEPMCTGVETKAQLEALHDIGCNQVQGFAVAKPMPACKVPQWLSKFEDDTTDEKKTA